MRPTLKSICKYFIFLFDFKIKTDFVCKKYANKKGFQDKNLKTLAGVVENTGLEPVTSCLPGKRSSQLS